MLRKTVFFYLIVVMCFSALNAFGENSNDMNRFAVSLSGQNSAVNGDLTALLTAGLRPSPDAYSGLGFGFKAGVQIFPNAGLSCGISYSRISGNGSGIESLNIGSITVIEADWFNRFMFPNLSVEYYMVPYLKPYYGLNYTLFNLSADIISIFSDFYPYFTKYQETASGLGGQAGLEFGLFFSERFYAGAALELSLNQAAYRNSSKKYMFWNVNFPISIGFEF